jgi:hypothetical protein
MREPPLGDSGALRFASAMTRFVRALIPATFLRSSARSTPTRAKDRPPSKASEGVFYCDPRALENLDRRRNVGLICNVYTSSGRGRGARSIQQVQRAVECAGETFTMRRALDLESAPDFMTDARDRLRRRVR